MAVKKPAPQKKAAPPKKNAAAVKAASAAKAKVEAPKVAVSKREEAAKVPVEMEGSSPLAMMPKLQTAEGWYRQSLRLRKNALARRREE